MFSTLFNLAGGVGLLLVGMGLMTDGLKLASGNALRDMLALWTNSRIKGLLSGFLITGLVQSSSAVTIATIGFANAGMLTLERAIWVIYGSNVGTTITAWIVALAGFKVDIEGLALPLVGLGAALKFTGAYSKRSSLGMALVGFGLLFLGISFLKDTFANVGNDFTLPAFGADGLPGIAVYVVIGLLLTTLMQSSSAAMVVTLSAAASGILPLHLAAATVIGANLGTTTTALIASAGATATARRVAVSHVAFNVLTATVAMFILNPMLDLVTQMENSLAMAPMPEMTLAIFHTVFNVLGVLLMWPLSARLTHWLQGRFVTQEELSSKPRHLDHTLLALPYIATDALALEVARVNRHTISALRASLRSGDGSHRALEEYRIVRRLADEIGHYAAGVSRNPLTPFLSETVANLLESTQQYLLVIDIAEDIDELSHVARQYFHHDVMTALQDYLVCISRHLDIQDLGKPERNVSGTQSYDAVEIYYRRLKDAILRVAARGEMNMVGMDQLLQYTNQAKRACRQILKATQRLMAVRETLQRNHQDKEGTARDDANAERVLAAGDVTPDDAAVPAATNPADPNAEPAAATATSLPKSA